MPDGHPIGPGDPPSYRDEPDAYAVWVALVRVRSAFDWADVARDVAEHLRRQGVTGEHHDRLRAAERQVEELSRTNGALRAQWAAREAMEARSPGCAEHVKGRCSTHGARWSGDEYTGCDAVAPRCTCMAGTPLAGPGVVHECGATRG